MRYVGPNLGLKNPQILNFIRNKKIWCPILDNKAHFPNPFKFLEMDENWLWYAPQKGPKEHQDYNFTHFGAYAPKWVESWSFRREIVKSPSHGHDLEQKKPNILKNSRNTSYNN